MSLLFPILASVLIISLISFIGAILLFFTRTLRSNNIFFFVAFAAGSLLGAAFLDLLPESFESGNDNLFALALLGILFFFVLERFIFWHHHHAGEREQHSFTYLNLVGDAIHNFVDGAIIAASFLTDLSLGVVTTIAIAFHEIPQEIGDFSILLYGGLKKGKALFLNFLSALTAVLGALLTYVAAGFIETSLPYLISFAAGGFIYIASADLIPELQKETNVKRSFLQFCCFLLGVGLIAVVIGLFE